MNTPPANTTVTEQAAYWCMRLNEPGCTAQERKEFAHWLAQSPAHAEEFAAMEDIWAVSDHLPRTPRPALAVRPRRARRYLACAACVLLALPVAGLLGWYQNWLPSSYERYEAGEKISAVQLPDGSQVDLNLNTSLSYANYRDHRQVVLRNGEAFFKVQHDARHPFVVDVGRGSVTVTGTRFNVWSYNGQAVVTLIEGSVNVLANTAQPSQVAMLSPGMQASYGTHSEMAQVGTANPTQALAWRSGKLILDDLTLAEALPRINRYLIQPAVLGDRASGSLRIGGIYDTGNVQQLVRMLPNVLPVYLSRNAEGNPVINTRRPPSKG